MTFEYAPVTKGLMLGIALTSIAAGIFDVKHYLHLQLVPHVSKYYQYWRLFSHHVACASSSDLLLTELSLYNAAVHIERGFGSLKYASFIMIAIMLNTISTFLAQLILHPFPWLGPLSNHISPGPTAVVFSIIYQYFRLVPHAYEFKVFGVVMSDKIWVYATVSQLALGHTPSSLLTATIGLITGSLYRSDLLQLKGWRVPHRIVLFSQHWVEPVLGVERPGRRSNRVFPEVRTRAQPTSGPTLAEDEVVTTARAPRPRSNPVEPSSVQNTNSTDSLTSGPTPNTVNARGGVMRQWVSELTGAARPGAGGEGTVRVPNEAEIQTLTAMFPDLPREVVLGVLQRSANIETAAETLLSST